MTIDLKQAKPGQEVRIGVSENYDMISDKVKGFVDSYNAALGFIQSQAKLTAGQSGRQRLGPLGGESFTRMAENKLRQIIQNRKQPIVILNVLSNWVWNSIEMEPLILMLRNLKKW